MLTRVGVGGWVVEWVGWFGLDIRARMKLATRERGKGDVATQSNGWKRRAGWLSCTECGWVLGEG